MRVKIGAIWFEATPNSPIMVELSEADKLNINRMTEGANRYAEFHDDDQAAADDRLEWMDAGAVTRAKD